MAMSQALALTADLKLGWYTSIPPREMFACQIIGTILGCFANCELAFVKLKTSSSSADVQTRLSSVSLARRGSTWTARLWILRGNGLDERPVSSTPPVSSGVRSRLGDSSRADTRCCIWGELLDGGMSPELTHSFVLGAAVPIACWLAHKRWPDKKFHKVS